MTESNITHWEPTGRFQRLCASHQSIRPTEGGVEVRAGLWVCSHCWRRGMTSEGAFVRKGVVQPFQFHSAPVEQLLNRTASAWALSPLAAPDAPQEICPKRAHMPGRSNKGPA